MYVIFKTLHGIHDYIMYLKIIKIILKYQVDFYIKIKVMRLTCTNIVYRHSNSIYIYI